MKHNYDIFTEEQLLNLISSKESHLRLINYSIEDVYDKIGPINENEEDRLGGWLRKKAETENEIRELKEAYNRVRGRKPEIPTEKRVEGKIVIEYSDLNRETLNELYRVLNQFIASDKGFNYRTVTDESE